MCCFLQIGQLLLGQFTLAVVSHNQQLILNLEARYVAAQPQALLELAHGIRQGNSLHVPVVRMSSLAQVGWVKVMTARKLEGQMPVPKKGSREFLRRD